MKITFHDEATEELYAAAAHYDREDEGLGADFLEATFSCMDKVASYPEGYPNYKYGSRRALLQRFPYAVVYWLGTSRLHVVAIMHTRRNPEFLFERLQ
jgi:plasmid stabilization system protein ParE